MAAATTETPTAPASPYELFDVEVAAVRRVTPHLVRLTFAGPRLQAMADRGYDQRIKLVLAREGGTLAGMPRGADWYNRWRLLDEATRPCIRTYTVRAVRQGEREIDVDMVDHGPVGPASRFARTARVGDRAMVLGPSADYDGDPGGLEYRHDLAGRTDQLVVGDDTALPAVVGILERLPAHARGLVSLEVGSAQDVLELDAPTGVEVVWSVRGPVRGAAQAEVVRRWLDAHPVLGGGEHGQSSVLVDGEDGYWEVTTEPGEQVPPLSAWVAGESSVVKAMRRMLVEEYDVPKAAVAFMGYWRVGRAEC